jgi:hypothetical protein
MALIFLPGARPEWTGILSLTRMIDSAIYLVVASNLGVYVPQISTMGRPNKTNGLARVCWLLIAFPVLLQKSGSIPPVWGAGPGCTLAAVVNNSKLWQHTSHATLNKEQLWGRPFGTNILVILKPGERYKTLGPCSNWCGAHLGGSKTCKK